MLPDAIRDDGKRIAMAAASLRSKCVRIFSINIGSSMLALHLSHDGPAFGERGEFGRICRANLVTLATLGWYHLCTMRAIGGKYVMKPSQVSPDSAAFVREGNTRIRKRLIERSANAPLIDQRAQAMQYKKMDFLNAGSRF